MKVHENLKAYCDGELSIAERHTIAGHLEVNDADRKTVDDLRKLSAAVAAYVTQPAPIGLEVTLAALEVARPRVRSRLVLGQQLRWIGGTVVAVAGVWLVATVLFPVYGQSKDSASLAAKAAASEQSTADSTTSTPSAPPRAGAKVAGKGAATSQPKSRLGALSEEADTTLSPLADTTPRRPVGIGRPPLIQKSASLTVRVKNVADAQQNVEALVAGYGGWIQASNRDETEGQTGTATLAVRVPVSQFDRALKAIRALGDVIGDSSSGNDVTGDVVDMDARLKVLRAEEADYTVLLGRARRIGEIMEIRDKLTEVRTEIEDIVSRRNITKDTAAFSSIQVTLQQRPLAGEGAQKDGSDAWLADTWATAVNGLSTAAKLGAELFIFVFVWAPIWLPISLLSAWIHRKLRW